MNAFSISQNLSQNAAHMASNLSHSINIINTSQCLPPQNSSSLLSIPGHGSGFISTPAEVAGEEVDRVLHYLDELHDDPILMEYIETERKKNNNQTPISLMPSADHSRYVGRSVAKKHQPVYVRGSRVLDLQATWGHDGKTKEDLAEWQNRKREASVLQLMEREKRQEEEEQKKLEAEERAREKALGASASSLSLEMSEAATCAVSIPLADVSNPLAASERGTKATLANTMHGPGVTSGESQTNSQNNDSGNPNMKHDSGGLGRTNTEGSAHSGTSGTPSSGNSGVAHANSQHLNLSASGGATTVQKGEFSSTNQRPDPMLSMSAPVKQVSVKESPSKDAKNTSKNKNIDKIDEEDEDEEDSEESDSNFFASTTTYKDSVHDQDGRMPSTLPDGMKPRNSFITMQGLHQAKEILTVGSGPASDRKIKADEARKELLQRQQKKEKLENYPIKEAAREIPIEKILEGVPDWKKKSVMKQFRDPKTGELLKIEQKYYYTTDDPKNRALDEMKAQKKLMEQFEKGTLGGHSTAGDGTHDASDLSASKNNTTNLTTSKASDTVRIEKKSSKGSSNPDGFVTATSGIPTSAMPSGLKAGVSAPSLNMSVQSSGSPLKSNKSSATSKKGGKHKKSSDDSFKGDPNNKVPKNSEINQTKVGKAYFLDLGDSQSLQKHQIISQSEHEERSKEFSRSEANSQTRRSSRKRSRSSSQRNNRSLSQNRSVGSLASGGRASGGGGGHEIISDDDEEDPNNMLNFSHQSKHLHELSREYTDDPAYNENMILDHRNINKKQYPNSPGQVDSTGFKLPPVSLFSPNKVVSGLGNQRWLSQANMERYHKETISNIEKAVADGTVELQQVSGTMHGGVPIGFGLSGAGKYVVGEFDVGPTDRNSLGSVGGAAGGSQNNNLGSRATVAASLNFGAMMNGPTATAGSSRSQSQVGSRAETPEKGATNSKNLLKKGNSKTRSRGDSKQQGSKQQGQDLKTIKESQREDKKSTPNSAAGGHAAGGHKKGKNGKDNDGKSLKKSGTRDSAAKKENDKGRKSTGSISPKSVGSSNLGSPVQASLSPTTPKAMTASGSPNRLAVNPMFSQMSGLSQKSQGSASMSANASPTNQQRQQRGGGNDNLNKSQAQMSMLQHGQSQSPMKGGVPEKKKYFVRKGPPSRSRSPQRLMQRTGSPEREDFYRRFSPDRAAYLDQQGLSSPLQVPHFKSEADCYVTQPGALSPLLSQGGFSPSSGPSPGKKRSTRPQKLKKIVQRKRAEAGLDVPDEVFLTGPEFTAKAGDLQEKLKKILTGEEFLSNLLETRGLKTTSKKDKHSRKSLGGRDSISTIGSLPSQGGRAGSKDRSRSKSKDAHASDAGSPSKDHGHHGGKDPRTNSPMARYIYNLKAELSDEPDPTGEFPNKYERLVYFRYNKKFMPPVPPLQKGNLCPQEYIDRLRVWQTGSAMDRNRSPEYIKQFYPENRRKQYKKKNKKWEQKMEMGKLIVQRMRKERDEKFLGELAKKNFHYDFLGSAKNKLLNINDTRLGRGMSGSLSGLDIMNMNDKDLSEEQLTNRAWTKFLSVIPMVQFLEEIQSMLDPPELTDEEDEDEEEGEVSLVIDLGASARKSEYAKGLAAAEEEAAAQQQAELKENILGKSKPLTFLTELGVDLDNVDEGGDDFPDSPKLMVSSPANAGKMGKSALGKSGPSRRSSQLQNRKSGAFKPTLGFQMYLRRLAPAASPSPRSRPSSRPGSAGTPETGAKRPKQGAGGAPKHLGVGLQNKQNKAAALRALCLMQKRTMQMAFKRFVTLQRYARDWVDRMRHQKNAKIIYAMLTLWAADSRHQKFSYIMRRFYQHVKLIQRFWRRIWKRHVKLWKKLAEDAKIAERKHHALMWVLRTGGSKGGPPPTDEQIDAQMVSEAERLSYIRIEMRARRYLLLTAIKQWRENYDEYLREVADWKVSKRAMDVLQVFLFDCFSGTLCLCRYFIFI